eukprot:6184987-Pleurochrysis_carterae.AAC.1
MVHPLVEYVHDYAGFFNDCIYDRVEGINDARIFILRERDDGGVCASAACTLSTPIPNLSFIQQHAMHQMLK